MSLHAELVWPTPMPPRLSEEGYQGVARLKSDEAMMSFVRRVLTTMDLEPADEGELSGFVPHFSGTKAVQTFDRLRGELASAPWTRRIFGGGSTAETTAPPTLESTTGKPKLEQAIVDLARNTHEQERIAEERERALEQKRAQLKKPASRIAQPRREVPEARSKAERALASAVEEAWQGTGGDDTMTTALAPEATKKSPPTPNPQPTRSAAKKMAPKERARPAEVSTPKLDRSKGKGPKASALEHDAAKKAAASDKFASKAKRSESPTPKQAKSRAKAAKAPPLEHETAKTRADTLKTAPKAKRSLSLALKHADMTVNAAKGEALGHEGAREHADSNTEAQKTGMYKSLKQARLKGAPATPATLEHKAAKKPSDFHVAARLVQRTSSDNRFAPEGPHGENAHGRTRPNVMPARGVSQERPHSLSLIQTQQGQEDHEEAARDQSEASPSLLPPVRQVLLTATHTLKDFTAETDRMRHEVEARQNQSRASLAAAKKAYEIRLAKMKADHEATLKINEGIRHNISQVNATNAELLEEAHRIKKSIQILRSTVKKLRRHVEVAEGFVGDSINVTDMSNSSELKVLDVTTPAPTLDFFLGRALEELGVERTTTAAPLQEAMSPEEELEDALSLLQMPRTLSMEEDDEEAPEAGSQDPKKMTAMLRATILKLDKAEKNGEKILSKSFRASEGKWQQRMQEALGEQKVLTSQLSDAVAIKADLEAARKTLGKKNVALRLNLDSFTSFLRGMDEAVVNALPLALLVTVLRL